MTIDERLERFEQHANEKFEQLDRFQQHVDEKFEQIDRFQQHATEQFEQIDRFQQHATKKFEQLDRFEQHATQEFQRLDGKIDGVNSSLRVLIEHQCSAIATLAEGFAAMNQRFDRIEANQEAWRAELTNFIHALGGNHEVRIKRLETHTGLV